MKKYPKEFENFWRKLKEKEKATKIKNGFKFTYWIQNGFIYYEVDDEQVIQYVCKSNEKKRLYYAMLEYYLVPRE